MTARQTPCMRPGSGPPDSLRALSAPPAGGGPTAPRPRPGHLPDPAAARGDGRRAGGADRRQLHQRHLGHRGVHRRRRHAAPGQPGRKRRKIERNGCGPARETHRLLHHACSGAGSTPATSPRSPALSSSPDPGWARPARAWYRNGVSGRQVLRRRARGARWLACRMATRAGSPCQRRRLLGRQ